jgi:parallel beta-helix repeat protein
MKHWTTSASVRLDRPLRLAPGALCDVSSALSNDFTIRNCYFHDHRSTGIRLYGGKGLVENNRFERIKDAAITVGNYISEGLWGGHVVIRNNKIRCICSRGRHPGAIALHGYQEDYSVGYPQAVREVVIENNTVESCAASGIYVNAADGVRISGNVLRRTNLDDFSQEAETKTMRTKCEYAIEVQNSINLDISGNTVQAPGKYCLGDVRLATADASRMSPAEKTVQAGCNQH